MLDVVAELMGHDVGLGERATLCPELRSQLLEEAEIQVDVAVLRAVERADVARRVAAAGVDLSAEEHGGGRAIGLAGALEGVLPEGLDAVDVADDAAVFDPIRIGAGLA